MNLLPVSVIIPTFNRIDLLPRALASVRAATLPGDEILVIDDASTDDTESLFAAPHPQLRYVRVPHGGAGAARNHGLRLAQHPLIAFMDSDDEWMPDGLHLHRTVLQSRPEVVFSCSNLCLREPNGTETPGYLNRWHNDARGWDEILGPGVPFSSLGPLPPGGADFRVHVGDLYLPEMEADYVSTITLVVRRERAGDALRFAEDLPVSEDKECIGRLAGQGLAAYLDCDTAWNWGHDGERLTDAKTPTLVAARLTLMERVWGSDPAFLAQHGDRYAAAVARQYCKRARWLMVRGRMDEARQDLRRAKASPLSYRLLAALPGSVVRGLLGVRRVLFR